MVTTPINIKKPRVEQKKMRVLSADELAIEIEQKLPWVEKVVTEWAISGTSARNLTPKVAQAKIGSTAKASLKNLESKEVFALPSPIRFEVDFKSPRYAYLVADIPGIERESGVSVRFTGSGFYSLHFGIIHWLEGNHRRIDLSGDIHFPFPTGHILFINTPISLNIKQPCGAA